MRILHLSDIHYRREYPVPSNKYEEIFKKLENPLNLLNSYLPTALDSGKPIDAVFLTGDLTENGDCEDYRRLKKYLEEKLCGIPIFPVLGNHDCKEAFWQGWMNQEPLSRPYHSVDNLGGLYVITLDNSRQGDPDGCIDEECCDWLEARLEELGRKPSVLLLHHHLLAEQRQIKCARWTPRFYQMVKGSGIKGIFCGHTHLHYTGTFAEKPYYCADAVTFIGTELDGGGVCFSERTGYSVYEMNEGRVREQKIYVFHSEKVAGYL